MLILTIIFNLFLDIFRMKIYTFNLCANEFIHIADRFTRYHPIFWFGDFWASDVLNYVIFELLILKFKYTILELRHDLHERIDS